MKKHDTKKTYQLLDILIALAFIILPIHIIGLKWLSINTLPTGGDTASHVFYAYQFCQRFPTDGLTLWMNDVFAGFSFLSYYFPLPFIIIFLIHFIVPFALAFKVAVFLPSLLLAALIYLGSVYGLKINRYSALFAAINTLGFIVHEENSIWGGNILSILSGEFAFSYGILFCLVTLFFYVKATKGRYYWFLTGLFEAATGFSHGYALLVTGFSSFCLLLNQPIKPVFKYLILSHGFSFCLLAGWLWPLLEMHNLTIANDTAFNSDNWQEFLPKNLWPVLILMILALPVYLFKQRSGSIHGAVFILFFSLLITLLLWISANQIGLADIRFYPFILLFSVILSGLMTGYVIKLTKHYHKLLPSVLSLLSCLGLLLWFFYTIEKAPHWSAWNHSGYSDKPNWYRLSLLFSVLEGSPNSPRLVFEHDPANNDIGSTRALEALPMFLSGRPVLEGLYMESAVLAPVIYQLQSELSTNPSSPLTRFPSGSMDIVAAAAHMNLLHSNEVLIRNDHTKTAFATNPLFTTKAISPPFTVYTLKRFTSQMVIVPQIPVNNKSQTDWMMHSFNWFKRYPNVDDWPFYTKQPNVSYTPDYHKLIITDLRINNKTIRFNTNQPGQPHIIKIAYHPKWRLLTPGQLVLAAPGFLMVVPESNKVEIKYDSTKLGDIAAVISLMSVAIAFFVVITKRTSFYANNKPVPKKFIAGILLIYSALLFYIHTSNPENSYQTAWKYMNQRDYSKAAVTFDSILQARKGSAKQEEVLFWSAKAYENAGNDRLAMARYKTLVEHYTGYWLPESLYTLARLYEKSGQTDKAKVLRTQLLNTHPKNRFSLALQHHE